MKKWIIGNLLVLIASGSFIAAPHAAAFQNSNSGQYRPINNNYQNSAVRQQSQSGGAVNNSGAYRPSSQRQQNVGSQLQGHQRQTGYPNHQVRGQSRFRQGTLPPGQTYQNGTQRPVGQQSQFTRRTAGYQTGRTATMVRQTGYQDLALQAPNQLSLQGTGRGQTNTPNQLAPRQKNPGGLHYSPDSSLATSKIVKGSSKVIEVDFDFKTILIEDPKIISGFPMSSRKVLIRGLESGVSAITLASGDRGTQRSFNISVENDVRQLQAIIDQSFPTANVVVNPLKNSVILRGTVPTSEMVTQILEVARRFSPEVIQNLQVAGAQNVGLQMKVYEVSRTKLRQFGIDWQVQGGNFFAIQSVSELIQGAANATNAFTPNGGDLRAGIINGDSQFFANIRLLEQHDVAKLVDEPFVVTLNGRPANFLGGGEIPIVVNAGLGVASIEFRPFGTKVDVLPFVLGDGRIKLDLQYEISQVAEGLSGDTDTPGFLVRRANGAVVMRAGHSLVIAGHSQKRRTNTKRGIPGLMHLNWGGSLFRDNQELESEIELLIVATPHFVGDVDPLDLPVHAPGQTTKAPSNAEYYLRGYHEVPNVQHQRRGYSNGAAGCDTGNCGPANGGIHPNSGVPVQGNPVHRSPVQNGNIAPTGQNAAPAYPNGSQSSMSKNTGSVAQQPNTRVLNQAQNVHSRFQAMQRQQAQTTRQPYSQQPRTNTSPTLNSAEQPKNSSIFRPLNFQRQ